MLASGLRSSCAASATNARCRSRAAASRSSIPFRVIASARISSAAGGTGRRSAPRSPRTPGVPLICSAPARSCSTGRSVQPITRHATAASAPRSTGNVINKALRSAARVASTSPIGTAAITLTGAAG